MPLSRSFATVLGPGPAIDVDLFRLARDHCATSTSELSTSDYAAGEAPAQGHARGSRSLFRWRREHDNGHESPVVAAAMVRRGAAILLALGGSIALVMLAGGCAESHADAPQQTARGGQSLSQARRELAHQSGLRRTNIEVDRSYSGPSARSLITVEGTVSNEALIPEYIDYMAQVGWSVNDVEPDTGIFVRIRSTSQPIIGAIARMNGWTTATYSPSTDGLKQFVTLPKAAVRQRSGDWPGPPPMAIP